PHTGQAMRASVVVAFASQRRFHWCPWGQVNRWSMALLADAGDFAIWVRLGLWVSSFRLVFGPDAIKMVEGANEELAARNGRRCVASLATRMAADAVEFGPRLEDEHLPVVVEEKQVVRGGHRRGAMVPTQVLHPQALARPRFQAARQPAVGDHEEIPVVSDG